MNAVIIAALIAATAALITSIVSLIGQRRTAAQQHKFEMQRDADNRASQLQQIMTQYRQPLLHAATDLQSRLYSIVRGRLLQVYGRAPADEKDYVIESTLLVFGEYFGWVEALRREVQFLDMGGEEQNRKLQDGIEKITNEFLRDDLEHEFRLFRGQQRAIGEVMLVPRADGGGLECVGIATFVRRVNEPDVDAWFKKLRQDLDKLTQQEKVSSRRVERVQGALIDLMDCLDPHGIRIPPDRRDRLMTV